MFDHTRCLKGGGCWGLRWLEVCFTCFPFGGATRPPFVVSVRSSKTLIGPWPASPLPRVRTRAVVYSRRWNRHPSLLTSTKRKKKKNTYGRVNRKCIRVSRHTVFHNFRVTCKIQILLRGGGRGRGLSLTVGTVFTEIWRQFAIAGWFLPSKIFGAYTHILTRHRVALHLTIRKYPLATLVISLARQVW